jgi:hypothetical protein
MPNDKSIQPPHPLFPPAAGILVRRGLPNRQTQTASSPSQESNGYDLREELLAVGRNLDSLYVAINAARGRLDALRSSLDAVEEAHRNIGDSFGALAYVVSLIR